MEHWNIEKLVPYARNPVKNDHVIAEMAGIIKEFGFKIPILVKNDGEIIDGHLRLKAAQKLGYTEVPVIIVDDWTESQVKAFRLVSRNSAKWAEWDTNLLQLELDDLNSLNFNLDFTGFKLNELKDLDLKWGDFGEGSTGVGENKITEGDDDIPEIKETESLVKHGDIFHLGHHRIMCGDCTKENDVIQLMGKNKGDMVFTDPPYNLSVKKTIGNASCNSRIREHEEFQYASGEMLCSEFQSFLENVFQNFIQSTHEGSIHYICMDWRHIYEIINAGHGVYTEFKQLCVWNKDNGGMGTFYRSKHELIFVFKNGSQPHINNFKLGGNDGDGRYRTNVWDYSGVNSFVSRPRINNRCGDSDELKMHPTVKPVQMVADAILDCSNLENIVVDFFLGSGTTLIAAEQTGRTCYGMEISELYIETIINRWFNYCTKNNIDINFKHINGDLTLEKLSIHLK